MRKFPYITVGVILKELASETGGAHGLNFSNTRYGRLEKQLKLPIGRRSRGNWRVFSRKQCEEIKKRIKENYGFIKDEKTDHKDNYAQA